MPRPRSRADQKAGTRARLVLVARRVFLRHGYDDASIAAVCEKARVTHGALYHHFAGKDALFAAVVAEVFTEVAERVRAAVDASRGWEQIEAACSAYLDACADPEVQAFLFRDGPRVLARGTFDQIDHAINEPLVSGMVERWMAEGLLAPRPVAMLARTLGAAFAEAGLLIQESPAKEHTRAQVADLLKTWIESLRRAPEHEAQPVLATDRLVLRPWQPGDEDALIAITAESNVHRFLFDGSAPSRAFLREATQTSATSFAAGGIGLWLARDASGAVVGFAGLTAGERGVREFVVATATGQMRQGLAREMAKTVIVEARARRCSPIEATVDEANLASRGLLDSLGFVATGRRRGALGEVLKYTLPLSTGIAT